MGRNIGRHTDRNTGCAVHQKVGETAGQNRRLLLRLIEVGYEGDCIFVDISQHLHGNLRETGLCITHGRSAVSVYTSEVSVSVHQCVAHGPGLCHIYQGAVDRTVSMGMIFTHGITDDSGTFSVRLIRSVIELTHRIQNAPLYGL